MVRIIFSLLITMFCVGVAAQPLPAQRHGDLGIETPWARATPPNARTGAVYLTLVNHGGVADRLVSASSTAAERVELHAHVNDAGVMRMTAIDAVALAPGERVSLRPGGLHVMLVDLKGPLREGSRLTVTLRFAAVGDVAVEVPVLRNPPAAAAGGSHGH
jgi:periplasmic copper chaperone A